MLVVGLTGSVGMGKSFAAGLLSEMGIPVFDADREVHALFENSHSHAVKKIARAFPEVVKEGALDRGRLGAIVFSDAEKRKALENILHPLIKKEKQRFITRARLAGAPLVVLDIPLLYEIGWDKNCHAVLVVTASAHVQKERMLSRPGMTEEKLKAILASQLPSGEKEKRADYVIRTDVTRRKVADQLRKAIADIAGEALKGES